MELVGADEEALAHAAVDHDADHLEGGAAIARALAARDAVTTIHVRLNGAAVAWLNVHDVRTHLEDFDAQLVTRNPRILEERHLAEVAADIRAADADAMHADQGFAGARRGRKRRL